MIKFADVCGDKTGLGRFCRFWGKGLRTIAYVDGYNLYYGRLQHTEYKWLDLRRLIEGILRIQDPAFQLIEVQYFTSPVKARLASRGQDSVSAQDTYHRALKARNVRITMGRHQLEPGFAPRFVEGKEPNRADSVAVWHLNEKETDVRLALSMYRDAVQRRMDQAVIVSGDTDLTPMVEALKQDFNLPIGLILPGRPDSGRPPPGSLMAYVDWTRRSISDAELADSQLPPRVPTNRKPADKPSYW